MSRLGRDAGARPLRWSTAATHRIISGDASPAGPLMLYPADATTRRLQCLRRRRRRDEKRWRGKKGTHPYGRCVRGDVARKIVLNFGGS